MHFKPIDAVTKVHPAQMDMDESSTHITNLGQGILMDIFMIIGKDYQKEILNLMLSCKYIHNLGTAMNLLWKENITRDFQQAGSFQGVSAYCVYYFLICFSKLAGTYIINNTNIHKPEKSSHFNSEWELLEMKITNSSGLALYVWQTDDTGGLSRGLPIFEEGISEVDAGAIHILPYHKDKRFKRVDEKEKRRMLQKWLKKKISLVRYLSSASTVHENMMDMIAWKYLIPLQLNASKDLDCKYLNEDLTWPQSLPKPGIFENVTGKVLVTVKYSDGHLLNVELMKEKGDEFVNFDIAVNVASAMTMTLEEQNQHGEVLEFLNYEKGLAGNPNKCTDVTPIYLPSPFRGEYMCRAWYSPVPAFSTKNKYKLIVMDEDAFMIVRAASVRAFTRKFRFEEEYAINLLE